MATLGRHFLRRSLLCSLTSLLVIWPLLGLSSLAWALERVASELRLAPSAALRLALIVAFPWTAAAAAGAAASLYRFLFERDGEDQLARSPGTRAKLLASLRPRPGDRLERGEPAQPARAASGGLAGPPAR